MPPGVRRVSPPDVPTLLLSDQAMALHAPGAGHPERPERLAAALAAAESAGLAVDSPRPATREALCTVHNVAYVDRILALDGENVSLDPDTHLSVGSVPAALLSAGALGQAVEEVWSRRVPNAFALVRPPGHHAMPERAMGFCLFNNVAIGAERARSLGAERVLIVDWDVHHGNGTEAAFYGRGDVLVFNTHQAPFYPGTGDLEAVGEGAGQGLTVNVPLPAGATGADYADVYERILIPIADAWAPDFVLVSAGFDAHTGDPLAMHKVDEAAFAWLCSAAMAIAERHAEGKLVLTLEGGYNTDALQRSLERCFGVLAGQPATRPKPANAVARNAVDRAALAHKAFWPSIG